jgi:hypothetical protein
MRPAFYWQIRCSPDPRDLEEIMTNKIMAACATLLLTASLHAADNTSNHSTTPFSGSTVNPCTGEPIQYFGSCRNTSKTQMTNEAAKTRTHTVCEAHGITPSGTIHRFTTNTKFETETPFAMCGYEQQYDEKVRVVSFGSDPNFFLNVTFHVRVNEQCQTEVSISDMDGECRGSGNP